MYSIVVFIENPFLRSQYKTLALAECAAACADTMDDLSIPCGDPRLGRKFRPACTDPYAHSRCWPRSWPRVNVVRIALSVRDFGSCLFFSRASSVSSGVSLLTHLTHSPLQQRTPTTA
eukprot:scaffold17360_cov68-Phaeocystis_antarctica.AAC.2